MADHMETFWLENTGGSPDSPAAKRVERRRIKAKRLVTEIRLSVEKTLDKALSDADLLTIMQVTEECISTGITDAYQVFYRCLLKLPDFADERDGVKYMLKRLQS